MLPAVGFAGHDDRVVCGVVDDAAAGVFGHVWKRIVGFVAAMPKFLCGSGCDVADPDGPRLWVVGLDEIAVWSVARDSRAANERDPFAIERPLRRRIAVHTRRDELYGFVFDVINAYKAVIASGGSEGEMLSVWRPFCFAVATAGDNLQRLGAAVERHEVELAVARVGDQAVRGDSRKTACVDFLRFAAGPRDGPNRFLHAGGIAGWVGKLARGIFSAAANIDECVAISGKAEGRKLLAVIF